MDEMTRTVVVTVQGSDADADHSYREDLTVGECLTFGSCGCQECDVDITVPVVLGQRLRGRVMAFSDHWRLDNLSADAELITCDLEDESQRLRIPPGRVAVVIPFELALVGFRGQRRDQMLNVFAQEPRVMAAPVNCLAQGPLVSSFELNPGTKYMAVLSALCCPSTGASGRLPTSAQIAEALTRRGITTTRRAVDHQIDYLFRRFFPASADENCKSGSKREAVARVGLASGLFRQGADPSETVADRSGLVVH